jgi:hydroxymethylbilane synthase
MHLRVGARGSDLSLAQTGWALERLRAANPGLTTEVIVVHTTGDKDQITPLSMLDEQGGFVKEIERALLDGRVDLAVHSLKDVPTVDTPGLAIAAMPERAPAGDVLLTRGPIDLARLPAGFTIGSSSPRRSHQLRRWNPGIRTVPLRGNVPTRIRHMMEGRFDAVVLAAAGLQRLGIKHPFTTPLPLEDFLPAPGQGSLALQVKQGSAAGPVVATIDHKPTRAAVTAERAFLRATGGGCHAALGALATVEGDRLTLRGEVFFEGCSVRERVTGPTSQAAELGAKLAGILVPPGTRL